MDSEFDRLEEMTRSIEGVIGGIDFFIDRPELSNSQKVEQIREILRRWQTRSQRPVCPKCRTAINACDEAVDGQGRPAHRDCI